jgi:hypothetical protein
MTAKYRPLRCPVLRTVVLDVSGISARSDGLSPVRHFAPSCQMSSLSSVPGAVRVVGVERAVASSREEVVTRKGTPRDAAGNITAGDVRPAAGLGLRPSGEWC